MLPPHSISGTAGKLAGGVNEEDLTDPEVIDRLLLLALPNENINDTILRLINQGGAWIQ
jgi:hypothetical protein